MQLTIYTCVTGKIRDELDVMLSSRPEPQDGVEYVYITDRLKPQIFRHPKGTVAWRIISPLWKHKTSGRRTARYHKANSHLVFPESRTTLWLDGAFQLNSEVRPLDLINRYLEQHHLTCFRHPERNCIYQELDACIRLKKDDPDVMRRQIARYKFEGYPPYNGLVETGCLFRRNSPEIRKFNELWWREIEQGSLRDQLSFNYLTWKLNLDWDAIQVSRYKSPHFTYYPHK